VIRERLLTIRGGLNQRAFAASLNLAHTTWARYETEGRLPEWETLQLLVSKGWNAHWMLTGEGPPTIADTSAAHSLATPLQALQRPATDMQRLQDAIEAVETGLEATHQMMDAADKAQLIVAVYELLAEPASTSKIFKLIVKGKV
jgi:transcriptional regulator with XRE-family HTH domain